MRESSNFDTKERLCIDLIQRILGLVQKYKDSNRGIEVNFRRVEITRFGIYVLIIDVQAMFPGRLNLAPAFEFISDRLIFSSFYFLVS